MLGKQMEPVELLESFEHIRWAVTSIQGKPLAAVLPTVERLPSVRKWPFRAQYLSSSCSVRADCVS